MARMHDAITVDLNADSTEWCPAAGDENLLAVGTYQLDEASGKRNGRCAALIARIQDNAASPEATGMTPSAGPFVGCSCATLYTDA